jgi:hypothetical protein
MLQRLVPGDTIIAFSPNKMQWQNEVGVHLVLSREEDLLGCVIYDFHPLPRVQGIYSLYFLCQQINLKNLCISPSLSVHFRIAFHTSCNY